MFLFAGCLGFLGAFSLGACPGRVGDPSDCVRLPGCESSSEICCDATRVCEERVCQGVGYICSRDAEGRFVWVDRAAPCDDRDPCTVDDLCVKGQCQGLPKICDAPPSNVCVDGHTLKSFAAPGQCVAGVCSYPAKDVPCGADCEDGACTEDPCKGVTCKQPPTSCYDAQGTCVQGTCRYNQHPAGTVCKSSDLCVIQPTCDAEGRCSGSVKDCTAPHAKGASCVPGTGNCEGYSCDSGYLDCNHDMSKDGCEMSVSADPKNCGACGKICPSAPHATAACRGGRCVLQCSSPYEDCDGTYANGCEIPVGVANSCNVTGLAAFTGNTPPCGTAYCGHHANDDTHKGFGTWYCTGCSHCYDFQDGGAWCLFHQDKSYLINFSPTRGNACTMGFEQVCPK